MTRATKLLPVLAAGLLAFSTAAPASAGYLAPRDACRGLDGAERFRMTLITAVANRDADILRQIVDPQVLLDFGGGAGWDEMRARLDSPDYRLWDELDAVIRLGCAPGQEGSLYMPYYWGQDLGDVDSFSTYIVLGNDVALYASATGDRVARRLDWEAVELVDFYQDRSGAADEPRWQVRTRSGKRGFVDKTRLRSLVDYRLIAERQDGRWLITTFVAGD